MISGSGSANAAVVGSITIPLMKRYGVPGTFAAAVETAASMGGLIMPPMMGVGAFLMSEFLGVPYWDVVAARLRARRRLLHLARARGLSPVRAPAAARHDRRPQVPLYDQIKTAIFFASVVYLVYLMGCGRHGRIARGALYRQSSCSVLLLAAFLYFKYVLKDPEVAGGDRCSATSARGSKPMPT